MPFIPPVPWLSRPDEAWPKRKPRRKRKEGAAEVAAKTTEAPLSGVEIEKAEEPIEDVHQTPLAKVSITSGSVSAEVCRLTS